MYHGHLNHYNRFDNYPDLNDNYSYQRVGGEGIIPTIVFGIIMGMIIGASFISYEITKRPAPDGSHVHWTWFGKPMINEDGQYRSHHFIHPNTCPVCKEVLDEIEKSKDDD